MSKGVFSNIFLVSDMDGTLLDGECSISSENKEALLFFTQNEGLFTIATGRMEFAIKDYLEELPLNAPIILYNGAAIYDWKIDEVIWSNCLNHDTESSVRSVMEAFPEIGVEIFRGGDVYFVKENEKTTVHRNKEGFTPIVMELEEVPKPWYKVLLAGNHDKLKNVDMFLNSKDVSFRTVFSEPQFLEILDKSASKGAALKELKNIIDIKGRRVVGIGDNMNDRELLEEVDIAFAVENAHKDLKPYANYSCCHHDEHAIKEVIEIVKQKILKNCFDKKCFEK